MTTTVGGSAPTTGQKLDFATTFGLVQNKAAVSLSANRVITAADDGTQFTCTTALTVTFPAGLSPRPSVAILPPPSGVLTVAVSGGALLNGLTTSATFTMVSNPAGLAVLAYSHVDGYGVTTAGSVATYNFSSTGGPVETCAYSVAPTGSSATQYVGQRNQVSWTSAYPITSGGWIGAREDVLNFPTGTLSIDKAVVNLVQANVTASGAIDKLLGHESEISSIAAGATINSYAAYYVPNLAGVANIGNIGNFYSWACDHVNSSHKNAGKYVNAGLVEYAPPYHPGIVAGRYYSAPHDTIAPNAVSADIIYFIPIYLPQRALVTKLGFTVTTLGAGLARLAIYRAKNGVPEYLLADAGTVSVASTGDKEITISTALESGTYFLAVNFNVACTVNWHQGSQAMRQGMFGSSTSSLSAGAQEYGGYFAYTFGAFPGTAGVMSYNPQQAEPHVWFRA